MAEKTHKNPSSTNQVNGGTRGMISAGIVAGQFIPALGFGLLLLSVIHEWVYFWMIGDFVGLLKTADLLAACLKWFPPFALATGAIAVYEANVEMRLQKQREKNSHQTCRQEINDLLIRQLLNLMRALGAILAIILMLGLESMLKPNIGLFGAFGCLVLWSMLLGPWLGKRCDIGRLHGSFAHKVFLYFPLMIAVISIHAYNEYQHDTTERAKVHEVTLENGKTIDEVNVLRTLSEGILIYEQDTSLIRFFPWHTISSVNANDG